MAYEYEVRNRIKFNDEIVSCINEIENLILNTNISWIGIGTINFYNAFDKLQDSLFCFGSYNDFYRICLNPTANSIVSVVEEYSEHELVSASIDQFFRFLVLYNLYERHFIFGMDFRIEELNAELGLLIAEGFSKTWVNDLIINAFSVKTEVK